MAQMGDLQPGCGGQIRPGGGHGGLEGCGIVFAGVLGSFPLWWPRPRALLLSRLAGGWALGAGSQGHGWGAPGGIVEGLWLEAGEGDGAVRPTPRRWQLMAIGNPESPFPEAPHPPSSLWRSRLGQPHPSSHWVVWGRRGRGHGGDVCLLGPTLRRGQRERGIIPWRTDKQPPSLGKGSEEADTYPPHQYQATHASCSSSTKQGVSSTLKKATPTRSETESRWFCRHCRNLPQSRHSGPRATEGPWLLPKPTSHYQQVAWVQKFLPSSGQCGSSV